MKNYVVRKAYAVGLAALLMFVSVSATAWGASETTNVEYQFKAWLEARLEDRLKTALSEIAGTEKLIVIVNAEVEALPEAPARAVQRPARKKTALVLPGVPVKQEIGKEEDVPEELKELKELPPSEIRSIRVIVLVGENLADELIDIMRDVAINAIGYDPDRGDAIDIRQLEFTKKTFPWLSYVSPPNIYFWILTIMGALLMAAVAMFMYNPFRRIPEFVNSIDWNAVTGRSPKDTASESGPPMSRVEAALTRAAGKAAAGAAEGQEGFRPFGFIREQTLGALYYILEKGPLDDAALVINYLDPELGARLIERFPMDGQVALTMELGKAREAEPARIAALEEAIKGRLDYVVGGEARMASVLNMVGDEVREGIMRRLEDSDEQLALTLHGKVRSFEDIIRALPPHAIQLLYRQSDPTLFALTIMNTPEDVRQKVMDAMSEGVAQRLQEEMRLSHPLSRGRLRREKNNIITLVRRMVQAGIIEDIEE